MEPLRKDRSSVWTIQIENRDVAVSRKCITVDDDISLICNSYQFLTHTEYSLSQWVQALALHQNIGS